MVIPRCERATYVKKSVYHATNVVSCPSPGCDYAWCKRCVWSAETDNENEKQHSCDGVSELRTLMAQQGWKYCPGCKTPTERITGCNHMTVCGISFSGAHRANGAFHVVQSTRMFHVCHLCSASVRPLTVISQPLLLSMWPSRSQ